MNKTVNLENDVLIGKTKDELESLVDQNVKIEKSFYELGNWGIILEKV